MATEPSRSEHEAGKYRVVAQLGQGGTADVALAARRGPSGFNKLVVLKSMRSHLKLEPEIQSMFLKEARLSARLNHPNVVQTNEVFESADGPVIVMEYLEGQPLSSIVHRARAGGELTREMHLRVICEALSGLHYAHELADFDGKPLGVVHRDVSPQNVFVTFDGQVKLLDFGIAKQLGAGTETATGVVKGKLRYMSPEQMAGAQVDRRADVFAVGLMLWEAVAADKMWHGLVDAAIMNRVINDERPKRRERCPDAPAPLVAIVEKALASEPAARYQTAAALRDDIEKYLASTGSLVRLRDLGKVVEQLFADVRAETQRTIEAQLAKVSALSPTEYATAPPIALTQLGVNRDSSPDAKKRAEAAALKRSWLFVGVASLLALILIWPLISARQASPPLASPSTPSPPLPLPKRFSLHVTAFPAAAKIYLDGELLASNPSARTVNADRDTHLLEARADGFATESRTLRFEQDHDIVLSLVETPAAPLPRPLTPTSRRLPAPASAKPVASAVPAAAPSTPARTDCNPPYTLDARGVKQFKLQCL